ncbi:melanopsin-A-like [Nerophis lumbriciformis]|uniref:melanopsin-A-like n=1 Tax=Nerophis lumbriciformis TaxID=546530 RepID=UPI002AE021C5|nr:melanopsin-A-like [Nerophis lumbriciformis]
MDSALLIGPGMHTPDPGTRAPWNMSSIGPHRLMELAPLATAGSVAPIYPFPTVDVPAHAHYTIGVVILAVGITGILGNFLVIYVFCRSRSLRTPSNIFIINLAVTDFFMCVTQTPVFFITSMHKRWIFGVKGCELYAFCGALFGICSMITLMVIAVDRYVVITRPLASLGAMSRRKALSIVTAAWIYSMGWSLPPFFGWSAYVPEGLMTSCSWDYITFTPSVRSYTMLLFTFVFFIPLAIIVFCYCCIFRAIRHTTRAFEKINSGGTRESAKRFHRMKSEWKMAKIALIVIMFFIISWAPYSCAALTAFAGHADLLTPYMHSVPAVIAKASAIHNPIIYAITHPKYRSAISRYVPYLGALLCIKGRDRFSSSSFQSTRRSTVTSQSEIHRQCKPARSSQSDSESARLSDVDEDSSFRTPVNHQLTYEVKHVRHPSLRLKTTKDPEDIFMSDLSLLPKNQNHLPACSLGRTVDELCLGTFSRAPPAVIATSISSPSILHSPPGFHGNLKLSKTFSAVAKESLDIGRLDTTMTA